MEVSCQGAWRRSPIALGQTGAVDLDEMRELLTAAIEPVLEWQAEYGAVEPHGSLRVDGSAMGSALGELGVRLRDNYPFHHPRYAGQMLKPPHPVAVAAYTATMLINPNNHALDGGPATAALEKEVVADLAAMFGVDPHLGHLTSSGTIANLEALFVARESQPGLGVAFSAEAHYTHSRMCGLLGVRPYVVPADAGGRMDLDALAGLLRTGEVGTVVATLGTTGLGAVDPVDGIVALAREHGARVHIDAAYGGFFTLVADGSDDGVDAAPFAAVRLADSVVVDPHKHGLQPYGCGAVLFADPSVGRFYAHDSPYTYFTSDELHLGEISLECSRAGAAAAALWTTLRVLPLTADGLGAVLRPGLRSARRWAALLTESEVLTTYQAPQLDIVSLLPRLPSLSQVDAASAAVMQHAMTDEDPVFLATFGVSGESFMQRRPEIAADVPTGRILRSVLMKPEHEAHVGTLHTHVEATARAIAPVPTEPSA
jgi:glutamate/tyrosine decarboxylase-like PLP-dependent enzyme